MSDVNMQQLLTRLTRLEDQVSRLVAREMPEILEFTAWTPELYGAATPGTITYTTQDGTYFVIDNLVFIHGRLVVNAVTVAPTGGLRIRTLPYTTFASAANPPLYIQARVNLTAGYSHLSGSFPNSLDFIVLTENGDNVAQNFPSPSLAAGDDIRFAGFYRMA